MKRNTFLTKAAATVTATAAALAPLAYMMPANAAISLTLDAGNTGTANMAAATKTEVEVSFANGFEFADTDTVVISVTESTTGQAVAITNDCAVPTVDADGDTDDDGSATVTGGDTYTYTFGGATPDTTTATTDVTFCFNVDADADNYAVSVVVTDASTASNNDVGSTLLYVGDANDVQVEADVEPTLAFEIREPDDSDVLAYVDGGAVGPHLCDMGTLTTSAVGSCSYRLKVSTNAASGYAIYIGVNQNLQNASGSELSDVTDNTVTLNNEEYGIAVSPGSITGTTPLLAAGAIGVTAPWDDTNDIALNDTNAPSGQTAQFLSADAPNAPTATDTTNTSLVTHKAGITASTAAGLYTQVVTYTVTPTF